MNRTSWAFTEDLSPLLAGAVGLVVVLSLGLLLFELRRRERYGFWIFLTGLLGLALAALTVLRPVRVTSRGTTVGPRVIVLLDRSRRLLLPGGAAPRAEVARSALQGLTRHFADARLSVMGFGEGAPVPLDGEGRAPLTSESDLVAALQALGQSAGERPQAVVVVSDGRLSRPGEGADAASLERTLGGLGVPVHTVAVTKDELPDASIRSVRAAGAAVAHQALALKVQIGCSGGLACQRIPVTVRELRQGAPPALLASGVAELSSELGTVELEVTLERAGARVVQIDIETPEGDRVKENDTRILTFDVARERVRLLHVAGRPTYDVRALRTWLKSDESVDLVAFFILRTESDDTGTEDDSELALIPFPVDELFTQHLPSFDAVILQDIDADRYHLAQHLPALAEYVQSGGGLIIVGGPSSFAGGGYAGTAIERVLPVGLPEREKPYDTAEFTPRYTEAGRAAPVLAALRELFQEELPGFEGSNTLGAARPSSIVLWEHPTRRAGDGPMPVLALAEVGDGRSVALGVDGTFQLAFGTMAASVAGRSYGALWDGLLGWLMRDPRYESARMELVGACIAGQPAKLKLTRLPGPAAPLSLVLEPLGREGAPSSEKKLRIEGGSVDIDLGVLEQGGYSARARIGEAPPTRFDFACERGGEAWSDTRPNPALLERIASATGGTAVFADGVERLPLPSSTRVAAERHVSPLLPPWAWASAAALALGAHWLLRRRGGLV